MLGLLSFILGLSLGMGAPLSISRTITTLPKNRVGEGLGLRLSLNRLTQVVFPVLLVPLSLDYQVCFDLSGFIIMSGVSNLKKWSEDKPYIKEKRNGGY
ncbi:hypothetical protein ACFFH4_00860 [Halalkalibacter alkalisediminis]|uniref:Major facilitator superfamily (MFS) profile domain-containing protein n=1 Tax=Halalkalibacter alkalisediminis TaxID=935616 RepID=A0ABV6NBJ5_9BACI